MPTLFAARSMALTRWASDVGLGKHIFKVGVAADKEAAKAAVEAGWAGETDWKIIASQDVDSVQEEDALAALARREKIVDPTYYPRIKGTEGLFRVSLANVTNALLVRMAMSPDAPLTAPKPKAKDVAEYLIRNALPPA